MRPPVEAHTRRRTGITDARLLREIDHTRQGVVKACEHVQTIRSRKNVRTNPDAQSSRRGPRTSKTDIVDRPRATELQLERNLLVGELMCAALHRFPGTVEECRERDRDNGAAANRKRRAGKWESSQRSALTGATRRNSTKLRRVFQYQTRTIPPGERGGVERRRWIELSERSACCTRTRANLTGVIAKPLRAQRALRRERHGGQTRCQKEVV